ncbi:MAG: platelet-activating factor acetylhydrolase IB subunit [Rariglobus sp.]
MVALLGLTTVSANPATAPVPRNDWMEQHESFNAVAQKGGVDVVFLGDSITHGWCTVGRHIWDERFVPLKAVNFGIRGDRTQHVLWRVQNGNFAGITPKVVVLMIGTNNSTGSDTAEQIAEGVEAIVKEIMKRSPATKVLLLGVFPRAEKPDSPARVKIAAINAILAKLDDGEKVVFLDMGEKFLQPDGTLTRDIMPDLLHLSPVGYQIWADAIQEKLPALLK